MSIADVLNSVRQFWATFVVIVVLAVAAGVGLFFATPATYASTSQVIVSTQTSGSNADLLQGSSFAQKQVASYAQIVTSPKVLEPVIRDLSLETTPSRLAGRVEASSPLNTVLINIKATAGSADEAAEIANTVADSFSNVVTELETPADGGASPVRVSVTRPGQVPTSPESPNLPLNIAGALAVGLILATAIVVLRSLLDTAVRSTRDVRAETDISILGEVCDDDDFTRGVLPLADNPKSSMAEEFRHIRTNLTFVGSAQGNGVHVVTSAIESEGKTTITANLALAFAQTGQRVCLVDADLRRPRVADYLGIEGSVGLTTALIGEAELRDVVQPWGAEPIWVLPSGQIPPNPSELLGSRAMASTLATLKSRFDVVLIDAPPLLPVTDASILAAMVRSVVLVTGCNRVHKPQLQRALEHLESAEVKSAGIVVNRVPTKATNNRYGAYYEDAPSRTSSMSDARRPSRVLNVTDGAVSDAPRSEVS